MVAPQDQLIGMLTGLQASSCLSRRHEVQPEYTGLNLVLQVFRGFLDSVAEGNEFHRSVGPLLCARLKLLIFSMLLRPMIRQSTVAR